MTRLETVLQENHCHLLDNTPTAQLASSFELWIDEEFEYWYDETLIGNDTDKKLIVNNLSNEMSFMVHRFQERLKDCINQYGKEVK